MKLFYAARKSGNPALTDFLNTLEPKLRQKLFRQFAILLKSPLPREPLVKHFTISKYSELYELRAKSKIMVRIIFTVLDDGSIIFLVPFIKKHTRNTMQALDESLNMLSKIKDGQCSAKELHINKILEELKCENCQCAL